MIDEFQDIDDLQYRLMCVLCGYHKNLFIVGDPDQTIYTWRGANVKYLLDFHRNFPAVQTVMMMENYRSTPQILDVANSLISKNHLRMEKKLFPTLPAGESVLCCHAQNQEKEALWISQEIRKLKESGVSYKDITILYRAHYLTRSIEQVFLKEEIPYTIYSGVQFFGRMEIKDALCYLRMVAYKDDLSFVRIANVPKRNLGERRMKFLQEYASQNGCSLYEALCRNLELDIFKGTKAGEFVQLIERFASDYQERPVSEVLSSLLDLSGYERMLRTEGNQERLDNLAELKQSVYEYETGCGEEATLEHYLAHVALFSNSDVQTEQDKVKLMTVHTSKGLEFPYVFICGLNEGIFPSRKTRTKEGMEEERRLAFVAMTRAKKRLYLSEAKGRNLDGSPRYPSRFILDIDQELLTYADKPEESLIKEAREYIELSSRYLMADEQPTHYPVGQKILHKIFGIGTIAEVDVEKNAYAILFEGMETPRTISFKVKLECV